MIFLSPLWKNQEENRTDTDRDGVEKQNFELEKEPSSLGGMRNFRKQLAHGKNWKKENLNVGKKLIPPKMKKS